MSLPDPSIPGTLTLTLTLIGPVHAREKVAELRRSDLQFREERVETESQLREA